MEIQLWMKRQAKPKGKRTKQDTWGFVGFASSYSVPKPPGTPVVVTGNDYELHMIWARIRSVFSIRRFVKCLFSVFGVVYWKVWEVDELVSGTKHGVVGDGIFTRRRHLRLEICWMEFSWYAYGGNDTRQLPSSFYSREETVLSSYRRIWHIGVCSSGVVRRSQSWSAKSSYIRCRKLKAARLHSLDGQRFIQCDAVVQWFISFKIKELKEHYQWESLY